MASKERWTTKELEILKKEYEFVPIEELIELLPGRSKEAIQWKANNMGLIIRNGKQIKANHKIIVNITEEQFEFLQKKRNHSRVIREALKLYMEKLK